MTNERYQDSMRATRLLGVVRERFGHNPENPHDLIINSNGLVTLVIRLKNTEHSFHVLPGDLLNPVEYIRSIDID